MAEPTPIIEVYLEELATCLTGSRGARMRLLAEVRQHVEEALVAEYAVLGHHEEAERRVLRRLGSAQALARAWDVRCSRLRARQRRRVAVCAAALAGASILAVAQHAEGSRNPARPPSTCAVSQAALGRCDDAHGR
jgi:hypothetical protein